MEEEKEVKCICNRYKVYNGDNQGHLIGQGFIDNKDCPKCFPAPLKRIIINNR